MSQCLKCGALLADDVYKCPICDTVQDRYQNSDLDNVDRTLTSSPNYIIPRAGFEDTNSKSNNEKNHQENVGDEVARLMKRGEECFNSGKSWLGAKDKTRARKDFQRAFKYYETILKLDPENDTAKEARAKCLLKMA
jgi:hypothetical protein